VAPHRAPIHAPHPHPLGQRSVGRQTEAAASSSGIALPKRRASPDRGGSSRRKAPRRVLAIPYPKFSDCRLAAAKRHSAVVYPAPDGGSRPRSALRRGCHPAERRDWPGDLPITYPPRTSGCIRNQGLPESPIQPAARVPQIIEGRTASTAKTPAAQDTS
jgi:hypothetical protein